MENVHGCIQKERIIVLESKVSDLESENKELKLENKEIKEQIMIVKLEAASNHENLKNLNLNIIEIKEYLKELPRLQAALWKETLIQVLETTKPKEEIPEKNNAVTMEVLKLAGKLVAGIVALAGVIGIIFKLSN